MPCRPATPRISPGVQLKDDASRSLPAVARPLGAEHFGSPAAHGRRRARREGVAERAAGDHADHVVVGVGRRRGSVAMCLPLRSTVTVSQKARTSRMRCEMKTIVTPALR